MTTDTSQWKKYTYEYRIMVQSSEVHSWEKFIPTPQEIDLYAQLNIQRVQRLIDSEALEHQQKMKEMKIGSATT